MRNLLMALPRWSSLLLSSLLATFFIAGCAHSVSAPPLIEQGQSYWTGRISLHVQSDPAQAFFAGFELKGRPEQGELTLTNPLGSNLAVLRWSPQEAVLDSGNRVQRFASVDELLERATGASVPLPALFDWLDGKNTAAGGWSADLSQQAQGKVSAVRTMPQPRAEMRIVLAQ